MNRKPTIEAFIYLQRELKAVGVLSPTLLNVIMNYIIKEEKDQVKKFNIVLQKYGTDTSLNVPFLMAVYAKNE